MAFQPPIETVLDHLAWSYANLARASAGLDEGATSYKKLHHIIRNKLYHGLRSGKMSMRSLYDDERLKMKGPQACYYCGSRDKLSVDHLIPSIRGGADESDDLIWACRSCDSSKGGRDLMDWMVKKERFPPILLLRRYLKLVTRYCDQNGLLDLRLEDTILLDLPPLPSILFRTLFLRSARCRCGPIQKKAHSKFCCDMVELCASVCIPRRQMFNSHIAQVNKIFRYPT